MLHCSVIFLLLIFLIAVVINNSGQGGSSTGLAMAAPHSDLDFSSKSDLETSPSTTETGKHNIKVLFCTS